MTVLTMQSMWQGDTYSIGFEVQDYDGAALNLTDCEIRWSLATPDAMTTKLIQKTEVSGVTILDLANGAITVQLQPADTETLSGSYIQELEVTRPDGRTNTHGQGPFIIRPTINPVAT